MSRMQRTVWVWCVVAFAISLIAVYYFGDIDAPVAKWVFLSVFGIVSTFAGFFVRKNFDSDGKWVGNILIKKV